ncbi:MAG: hypothetical protein ABI723_03680 [Bacteroidia bacterium]
MNAHRLIADNENGHVHITLPKGIDTPKVEIIVFSVTPNEGMKIKFTDYYGCWENKKTIEEIDEQIQKMRDEWERDF